jgi:hypothetical protein
MKSTPTRTCIAEAQDSAQNVRDFEYRAVLDRRRAGAKIIEPARHRRDPFANGLEGIEHDSSIVLLHPFGVIPLLRHGPCVSRHDDRQPLLHRFADTARAWLADEEIAELHEIADLG